MDGFIGFTDVQVSSSICFSLFWCGFISGTFLSDVPYYLIKWLLKKFKK